MFLASGVSNCPAFLQEAMDLVSVTRQEFCLVLNFMSVEPCSIYALAYVIHEILHENMAFFLLKNYTPDILRHSSSRVLIISG